MAELLTTETYKQAKALTGVKDDERLGIIISSVSQLVKTYCNNTFLDYATTPLDEYFSPDWQGCDVQVTESPILVVSGVSERSSTSEAYYTLTELTEYAVDLKTDSVRRIGAYWPVGIDAVKVTYTAGYASTPADLKLAMIDLTSYYMKEEHKITRNLGSASMHNPSGTLTGNVGFPDHIKRVLDLYRIP